MTKRNLWAFVFALGLGFSISLVGQVGIQGPIGIRPANLGGFYPSTGGASGTVLIGNGVGSAATFSATPTVTSLTVGLGAVGAPSLTFTGDTDNGWWSSGDNKMLWTAANLTRFSLIGTSVSAGSTSPIGWTATTDANAAADSAFSRLGAASIAAGNGTAGDFSGSLKFTTLTLQGKAATYNAVTTAGQGVPSIYGYGGSDAVTNTGTASIATYTVGAVDGAFEVGCAILITTSTTHSFSCDVTYTDTGGTGRTMVLPVTILAGTFATSGLMTNITGVGPYTSPVMTIRADAATAITVRTSAGGTFTSVVYNPYASIKQIG